MADMSVYDGIISPNGGLYKPGPGVVMPDQGGGGLTSRSVKTVAVDEYGSPILTAQPGASPFKAAETAIEARGGGSGTAGAQARIIAALTAANAADGSIRLGKDQSRMTPNQFGYGENGVSGNEAVRVAEALAANSSVPLPRKRPNIEAIPGTRVTVADDGMGIFGIPMSNGMTRNLAGKTAMSVVPFVSSANAANMNMQNRVLANQLRANPTQQALAQVAQAAAPAPVQPSYTTTPFQENAFQTTTGAQMPGSMNNSRWTTGY